jgi:hypothetical protein
MRKEGVGIRDGRREEIIVGERKRKRRTREVGRERREL